jgi:hypothetical protein
MATRGRKPILKERYTSCITLEREQADYLKEIGIELSEYVRDQIEILRKNRSSPIEQLRIEIEEHRKVIEENEMQIVQKENMIREFEASMEKDNEEKIQVEEFEVKKREYIIECIKMLQTNQTCNRYWGEHLIEAWKFKTFDDAKVYVREVWLESGVPDKRIKKYLRMD